MGRVFNLYIVYLQFYNAVKNVKKKIKSFFSLIKYHYGTKLKKKIN